MTMSASSNIAYLTNAGPRSGVGHRQYQMRKQIEGMQVPFGLTRFFLDGNRGLLSKQGRPVSWIKPLPGILGSKSVQWLQLSSALREYIAKTDKKSYQLFHATNQTLSFLNRHLSPMIVTVHDIIEVTNPQSTMGGLASKYFYKGIGEAEHVVAVSDYTASEVQRYYGVKPENITVIHNGVGKAYFPIEGFASSPEAAQLREELDIDQKQKVVLYVGSDHRRKNVLGAVEAFAQVARKRSDVIFVKVGEPGIASGRHELVEAIERLAIEDRVRFVGSVPVAMLNQLFNIADVFIFPSYSEGFGLPPLQAMACGVPVITSTATSLPEIVGEAAITHDPSDTDAFGQSLERLLEDAALRDSLIEAGSDRSKQFSWEESAKALVRVYKKFL